jgi:putative spermidine/putrescine transport system ATP-binding protein
MSLARSDGMARDTLARLERDDAAAPTQRQGHSLAIERVTHSFGAVIAVRDVSLDVTAGELVALLGPSGCGKSTLLRIIAGFTPQDEGRVLFDGASVDHLPPNRRGAGIVFQNYALFPHMSVAENVAYGLEARGTAKPARQARVAEMLALVQMEGFAERLPRQLSGGQQQRVALARALAVEPKVLLLDEPFGALDKNLRLDMQLEIKRLQRQYGITTILVTHDQEEALGMADRIAVLRQGAIEQFASPSEIYDRPATLFVNRFVGTTNLLAGRLVASGRVALDAGPTLACAPTMLPGGSRVVVSIRPELIELRGAPAEGVPVTVRQAMPLGPATVYELALADGSTLKLVQSREPGAEALRPGTVSVASPLSPDACLVFAADSDHQSQGD